MQNTSLTRTDLCLVAHKGITHSLVNIKCRQIQKTSVSCNSYWARNSGLDKTTANVHGLKFLHHRSLVAITSIG
jgi:hypothetical protein